MTLSLYAPDAESTSEALAEILPFPVKYARDSAIHVLKRSQTITENRKCPACKARSIQTIELHDGIKDVWRYTVPGTASLVGFRCDGCGTEWPVDRD